MRVRPGDAPTFSAGRGAPTAAWPSSSEVVSRCLAQLISLGQIGAAQDEAVARSGADPRVSAAVLVDYDAAGAGTLVGRAGQCPAFLTEVRPVAAPAGARMDVSYPRLPSWPLRPTGGSVPPYFGTARVRETDVDRDVQPPVSVELTGDRSGVVMRFGRDETSTTPEPFEMVCPSHFLSVFIGRFGRQHNQLQEVMHTLALARRVNRTFIVPVLVPETYIPFLRYDAQRLYGFNALRREGRYCLVSYAEARRMLKELEAQGEPMSLRRFNYYADPRPGDEKEWWSTEDRDWFEVPSPSSSSGARWFNVDAWLEDSKAREPPVTTTRDARPDGMRFFETEEDFTLKDVFPSGGEDEYVRMALMRKTIQMIAHLMGGDHRSVDGATPQPRLGVLTSRMAFYVHPSLREQTLLMGLLRPSEAISREADRLYARYAARLSWPTTGTELRDTLRTGNFKNVIGFHIRRREGTCRREGVIIDRTAYAIDPRFQLERVDPSWSGPLSTLRNMELDCALTKTRVVELYGQYVRWMRSNMTADPPASAPLVPTIYMAYDDQSGPIAEQVDDKLVEMAQSGAGSVMWGSAAALPPRFVASYDVRISGDFMSMYQAEAHRLESEGGSGPPRPKFDEPRRVKLVHALHSRAFTEMFGVAFDFFMLTNMGVFRGVMLSSVSTNVIMRRWGRGLPCHGVMAGYQKSFYTAMWV
ncbi:phosphoglycan beta 1 2 arabinosyltransferase (SCA1) [Leptomonas seymouri]|uniref:Phosphoglycan beta 1 2 arabinosyltransferase (SCA1) n=1 Tax=Leptomonas seymouri TaxID=5684 RepID=A0A0N1P9X3_LEPSE|nr:phosphoglycan beta 1 2 arabinosyltransferase (SCA1) [Leptomonas seymouri]|eukprot:KPI82598.1 phosphoglycan beta 1 2 arabinosyltransferase (SCA1) [Leptomonas seymouri]